MRVDLHTHSRVSDGTDSPAELVRAAKATGLDVVALTDHDTADGWDEAEAAAREVGITLVRGMEISTRFSGGGVHLLAYLPDATYEPLQDELARILGGRDNRLPLMVDKLRSLGIDLTEADVHAESGDATASGRPHVADALVRKGVVRDRKEAFDRYLASGAPGYVGRYAADLHDTIRLIDAAGGATVIAHPWGRSETARITESDLPALIEAGLSGIEVDHQDHDGPTRALLRAMAEAHGLIVTGSSDYHGTGKVDHDLGVNTTAPEAFEALLERAAAAAARSGRVVPEVVRP
ncbi:phosphatase [Nocardioides baekrokdamisoli]|uniref:Phosphatase n=1 Tax=Nocardioides baekrokdamisoli TaxID=1804624 RepID=A0A3G9IYR5_9ACTN|nr:PHP domain-containing protein [Nocardioides baekrokdamisoli]BBH16478.1 phosphatase [Nocardioides baekrokdamisoli]